MSANLLHSVNNEELEKISCYTTRNSLQLLLSKYPNESILLEYVSFLFQFSHESFVLIAIRQDERRTVREIDERASRPSDRWCPLDPKRPISPIYIYIYSITEVEFSLQSPLRTPSPPAIDDRFAVVLIIATRPR